VTISRRLEDYLRVQGVRYLEQDGHLGGRGLAKVVALRDRKGDWLIAVLPEELALDLVALSAVSGRKRLRLASAAAMTERFGPDSLTPFTELSGVPVYVDDGFADWPHIYFESESPGTVVGIRLRDYVRIARPMVGRFARAA
jgi:prolyl-tRNA editing enzyme YbaK/EbsC (Cys-tRNA(Pro) deacylase)